MINSIASTQTMRLVELHCSDAFRTPLEARFDRLTRLARASLRSPVAAITVRAGERLWLKSVVGWNVRELSIRDSLSERALTSQDVVVIGDTHLDDATAAHPLVLGGPRFRAYLGQALTNQRGETVGTFDVFDVRPRTFHEQDLQSFHDLVQLARKELLANDIHDAQVQLVRKLDVARREALMDTLTSVWNRRGADELLRRAIETADADRCAMAVCVIDICRFKSINDTHGHPTGDAALSKVARLLVSSVRDVDAVCRTGGDEFMIIMPRVEPNEAEGIANRLRRAVQLGRLKTSSGEITLSVTTGVAVRPPGDRATAESLVKAADQALYAARGTSSPQSTHLANPRFR